MDPISAAPRVSSRAPQHAQRSVLFFSPNRQVKRLRGVTFLSKPSALRVWLPSLRLCTDLPGSLFQLPTLSGFSLQSFAPLWGSHTPFGLRSPLLHLGVKPPGLSPVLQRFDPPKKAGLLSAPQTINSGRSRSCFPGPSNLSGFSLR